MNHKWTIKNTVTILCLATTLLIAGCAPSINQTASVYLPNNPSIPLEHLRVAAQYSNARAQYALGYIYFYGLGQEKNINEAMKWFKKSAQQGLLQARVALYQINGGAVFKQDVRFGTLIQPKLFQSPQYARYAKLQQRKIAANKHSPYTRQPIKTKTKYPHNKSNLTNETNNATTQWGNLTLRLYLGNTLKQAQAFIQQHQLNAQARIQKQKNQYAVVFGRFHTVHQAKLAIRQLPNDVRQQSPWIQSIKYQNGLT